MIAANVTRALPPRRGEPFFAPTRLVEVGGVPVGLIGLTSDIVARMHKAMAMGLSFAEGEEAHRELVARHARDLRGRGAQVVLVLSELGIHKDRRLADVVPPGAVDAFLSAHTHEVCNEPLPSASGALVAEAGNDGWLGRLDIALDAAGKVSERGWRLIPIDATIPEDPRVKRLVDAARAPFLDPNADIRLPSPSAGERLVGSIDRVVGRVETRLDRRGALESSFNRAFAERLRSRAGTDVGLTPGFRFDAVLLPAGTPIDQGRRVATGEVTLGDVYRLFPVSYRLARGTTSVGRLRALLEEALTDVFSTDAFREAGGWVEGMAGLRVRVDLARPDGQRVLELRLADRPETALDDSVVVTVAGCVRPMEDPGVLCSRPGFEQVRELQDGDGVALTPARLLIDALAARALDDTPPVFTEISGRSCWPTAPFVQPLPTR